ncbi:hypothetical protein B0H19DRAFT_1226066 [Mycena capillaripes]|nr:hypothetical protein B0H19DRAFT_1226066 [Mycena capillaripes]
MARPLQALYALAEYWQGDRGFGEDSWLRAVSRTAYYATAGPFAAPTCGWAAGSEPSRCASLTYPAVLLLSQEALSKGAYLRRRADNEGPRRVGMSAEQHACASGKRDSRCKRHALGARAGPEFGEWTATDNLQVWMQAPPQSENTNDLLEQRTPQFLPLTEAHFSIVNLCLPYGAPNFDNSLDKGVGKSPISNLGNCVGIVVCAGYSDECRVLWTLTDVS